MHPILPIDSPIELSLQTTCSNFNRLLEELLFFELAHQRIRFVCFRRSKYSPLPADAISLQELLKGHSNLSNDYRVSKSIA